MVHVQYTNIWMALGEGFLVVVQDMEQVQLDIGVAICQALPQRLENAQEHCDVLCHTICVDCFWPLHAHTLKFFR